MKKLLLIVAALVLLASTALAVTKLTAAPAGAATAPVTVTGSVVAGMKTAQTGVPVMLQFKVTNNGSTTFGSGSAPTYFMSYFVSSNTSITSVECVQNGTGILNHYDIGAIANNACQLDGLPGHASGGGAIEVNDNTNPPNLTVKACVGVTLNSKTYCGTVIVPLSD